MHDVPVSFLFVFGKLCRKIRFQGHEAFQVPYYMVHQRAGFKLAAVCGQLLGRIMGKQTVNILQQPCGIVYLMELPAHFRKEVRYGLAVLMYGVQRHNILVYAAEPDIIVLTGDIFDNRTDNKNSDTLLKAIAKKYPCYYVSGNHEYRGNMWETFSRRAESFGVTVLQGENVDIDGIMICGASAKSDIGDSVKVCADNADTNSFNVLLAHFPEKIDFYRSFGKFDLVLSGHAHGGQWRLPPFMNGLYAPGQGLFPKYAGGRYDFDDTTFIVSRGLSRTIERIPRIFNNPELVVIDILPEGEDGE